MANIAGSLYSLKHLDDLAQSESFIHKIHPLIKLLVTLIYIFTIVSYDMYEINGLLPFVLYPVLIFTLSDLPILPILKRILLVEPLIIGIGILNPLFDNNIVMLGEIAFSRGWMVFLSIFIKSTLTVTASILLIATTGMTRLASALRLLKVHKIFVLQLLLTYRYISVLIEELLRMTRAYRLKAPEHKGLQRNVWGSFAGQLLLRTFGKAQRVYQAMNLRGFNGEYYTGSNKKLDIKDIVYILVWTLFFLIARIYNLPEHIGSVFIF